MIYLILNFSYILVNIVMLFNYYKKMFDIKYYILSRINRKKFFFIILKEQILVITKLVIIKIAADLITSNITSINEILILFPYSILTILTLFIWSLIIFLLYILNLSENKILFIFVTIIFVLQYTSFYINAVGILVIASPFIFCNVMYAVILKMFLVVLLIIIDYILFKKLEILGGNKND